MADDFWAAGHHFVGGTCILERTVTEEDGSGRTFPCGRRWVDIMGCDDAFYDAEGYAHAGKLSRGAIGEIRARVDHMSRIYREAIDGVGSGIGAPAPDQAKVT